jgi:hypothetical protein
VKLKKDGVEKSKPVHYAQMQSCRGQRHGRALCRASEVRQGVFQGAHGPGLANYYCHRTTAAPFGTSRLV